MTDQQPQSSMTQPFQRDLVVVVASACLQCGAQRATNGNYCDSCHRIKFGFTPNAARNLLATGAQLLPELAEKFRALMELPPDRPEVGAAALIVRALLLRSATHPTADSANKNV